MTLTDYQGRLVRRAVAYLRPHETARFERTVAGQLGGSAPKDARTPALTANLVPCTVPYSGVLRVAKRANRSGRVLTVGLTVVRRF